METNIRKQRVLKKTHLDYSHASSWRYCVVCKRKYGTDEYLRKLLRKTHIILLCCMQAKIRNWRILEKTLTEDSYNFTVLYASENSELTSIWEDSYGLLIDFYCVVCKRNYGTDDHLRKLIWTTHRFLL